MDSDEFDDGVILHENAHLLSERFSRDDSPGGEHVLGDILDPRVAWSEGWANFFSGLVRANPIYRDSFGLAGAAVQEHDLEENIPSGDQPGYWSEFSVHSVLWDLVDVREDGGDTTQLAFRTVWQAFRGLGEDTFVYLPSFLDRLTTLEPTFAFEVEQIARSRSIDYLALAEPSVSNPFPRRIVGTDTVTGEVDSLSRQRANLAQSAHLYSFNVEGGAVSVRLDVTGLGPARNPGANDLDLLLMDRAGRVLAVSDRGLNGQSELISTFLPAGRYVIEIRSFLHAWLDRRVRVQFRGVSSPNKATVTARGLESRVLGPACLASDRRPIVRPRSGRNVSLVRVSGVPVPEMPAPFSKNHCGNSRRPQQLLPPRGPL